LLSEQAAAYLVAVAPRYAQSSLDIHGSSFKRLEKFAIEYGLGGVADLGEAQMAAFDEWLQGRKLSASTVYRTLGTVKLFLRWAYKDGRCLWDGDSYRIVNPRSRGPVPPTVAVMKRILELPDGRTPEGLRDLFALELLYVLGLRRHECCALDLGSLDLGAETLFVVGKGGDERLLPVGPKLKETASRYLGQARSTLLPASGEKALFLGDAGQRLTLEALGYIVKKYGAELGLVLSPHRLRHACATHLVEAGMELAQVQRLLGHRRIDSTERYAQVPGREVHREFLRSHPRAFRDPILD
jgi:site-specific recombinase XerD